MDNGYCWKGDILLSSLWLVILHFPSTFPLLLWFTFPLRNFALLRRLRLSSFFPHLIHFFLNRWSQKTTGQRQVSVQCPFWTIRVYWSYNKDWGIVSVLYNFVHSAAPPMCNLDQDTVSFFKNRLSDFEVISLPVALSGLFTVFSLRFFT